MERVGRRSLRDSHRLLESVAAHNAKDQKAALLSCRLRGLVHKHIDEANDAGETVIQAAAAEGASAADIRLLVAAGAVVNASANGSTQALHLASTYGRVDAIAALLEAKANVLAGPLISAASNGFENAVRMLLHNKANIDAHQQVRLHVG
jgi:ankyrin repeat protein